MGNLKEAMRKAEANRKVCSICKMEFTEYGNNAQPINNGRCCDVCNSIHVIPARVAMMYDKK